MAKGGGRLLYFSHMCACDTTSCWGETLSLLVEILCCVRFAFSTNSTLWVFEQDTVLITLIFGKFLLT